MFGWLRRVKCPFCGGKPDKKRETADTHKCANCAKRWKKG